MSFASTTGLKAAVPSAVRRIAEILAEGGFRSWAVGGCVRDELLAELFPERPAPGKNDWDLATDARPEDVKRLFRKVIPTGIQHGTVTVLMSGEGFEVTTLRGEKGYSDGRRPDAVYFVNDLHEDLARRDFTVNAIAYDILGDELHDPFGGINDLQRRLLRAVGDPAARFAEDGLRVLRCARLAATLTMEIEEATRAAIAPSLESYRQVSAERIHDEWFKAFKALRPSRAFEVMRDEGMLAITAPELCEAGNVLVEGAETDALTLALRTVDCLPPRPALRFAGLVHGVDAHVPSTSRAEAAARSAQGLAARLRLSNADTNQVVALVRHHELPACVDGTDGEVRRWLRSVGVDRLEDVFCLQECRFRAFGDAGKSPLERLQALRRRVRSLLDASPPLALRELAITGRDLIEGVGLAPGPSVGRALEALMSAVLEEPSLNTREQLLALARHRAQEP